MGALIAGFAPLSGGWWTQGIAAAAPVSVMFLLVQFQIALEPSKYVQTTAFRRLREFAVATMMVVAGSAVLFAFGAGASFIPGLAVGAGLLTLICFVLVFGIMVLTSSFGRKDAVWESEGASYSGARWGLLVIGGFLTAGLVLAADLIIKLLT